MTVKNILGDLKICKSQQKFICHILKAMLSVHGRVNFLNLSRYGEYCMQTYRYQFEKSFDWLSFNTELAKKHVGNDCVIAFDPSYLPKSRKDTPHIGTFWSGVSGKALHGIEIGCLAVVDIKRNTAIHLQAVQTPNPKEIEGTLVDHYAGILVKASKILEKLSKYLVVDGYFYKCKFFDLILKNTNLQIITKIRNDANLEYLYKGEKRRGKGRPKQFDGKVDWNSLPEDKWEIVEYDEDRRLMSAILWSSSLKRNIRVVAVFEMKNGTPFRRAILCSSDLTLSAKLIFEYYSKRFQIEFLFRDAKQFAGLTHSESRSENKLNFHSNASLAAVSVAKIVHFFDTPNVYSLADISTTYFNEFFANLIFRKLDIEAESPKIASILSDILSFGLIHQ